MKKYTVVIPARWESSRLPGKLAIPIHDIPVIQRTYNNVRELSSCVLTDSKMLKMILNGKVKFDETPAKNGTERIANVMDDFDCEVFINLQGDEILMKPEYIEKVASLVEEGTIVTIVAPGKLGDEVDMSIVKPIIGDKDEIISFSREEGDYNLKHIGVYGIHRNDLAKYKDLPKVVEEEIYSLEQFRWLKNGFKMRAVFIDDVFQSINTVEDLESAQYTVSRD